MKIERNAENSRYCQSILMDERIERGSIAVTALIILGCMVPHRKCYNFLSNAKNSDLEAMCQYLLFMLVERKFG